MQDSEPKANITGLPRKKNDELVKSRRKKEVHHLQALAKIMRLLQIGVGFEGGTQERHVIKSLPVSNHLKV